MGYVKLFEKGKIGSLDLKNRIVMSPMGVNLAQPNGEANEHIIRYYEERAAGGVGLIITEIGRVDDTYGVGLANQIAATKIEHISHLERLTSRVHSYGTKILFQLHHPGRETHGSLIGGRQIIAPSALMCQVTQEMPREMTTEECEAMVKSFVTSAVIAKNAGFDGVEIHCAHGYLLNEFLSPYTNKRTDKYGGSFDNRIRILEEIICSIRFMCGPDYAISVRLSADEFLEGGLKIEDTIKIARVCESIGADAINVSCGTYETGATTIEPGSYPQGWKKHLAAAIRKNVKIPVIAVNNIKEPSVAEQLLEEGVCDFVSLGRAHLADPQWANKAKTGREDEINRCIGCLRCFEALSNGRHICCTVNPRCGREVEFSRYETNGNEQPVAVIGGGPAGMEAALVLKKRGFAPVIFEKSAQLGGQLNDAERPILKDKVSAYKNALICRVEKAGIEVRLNTEATVEMVKKIAPVGVFVACGSSPIVPKLPGLEQENVLLATDALADESRVKGKVAVIGGGVVGVETAETLAAHGHEVVIVEMLKNVGGDLYASVLQDTLTRLKQFNVEIKTGQKLVKVDGNTVHLVGATSGVPSALEADTIVIALGRRGNAAAVSEFEKEFSDVIAIGDVIKMGNIKVAVKEGFERAYTFQGGNVK